MKYVCTPIIAEKIEENKNKICHSEALRAEESRPGSNVPGDPSLTLRMTEVWEVIKKMSFLEEAREKLRKELPGITGNKEGAIKQAAMDALVNFAGQDEEFAQAIVQGGKFSDCMKAVCKGIGTSISDLEVYSRAAAFYFPGCKVRFEMHLDLVGEAGETGGSFADSQDDMKKVRNDGEAKEPEKKAGLVFDLADFL